jgi:hypothetical protein
MARKGVNVTTLHDNRASRDRSGGASLSSKTVPALS